MTAGPVPSALGGRGACAAAAIGALLLAIAVSFALNFPALTGRIVDQANIIQPATRAAMEGKLAELESKSGIQLVVATVNSLEGQDIEPYANELFRNWKLGEKEKNNGVLLLVAPNERRVRIEVGYGLEKTLTDALSKVIIVNAITPRFKAGDFSGGISRGADDIITVLTTDASEWEQRPSLRLDQDQQNDPASWILFFAFLGFIILIAVSPTFRRLFIYALTSASVSSGRYDGGGYSGGGYSGGGGSSGGGGFSGGGGSSGGGGASGSW
ncbi:MAG: TPM domain-containing protein [Pseudolabrys sp.]